MRLYKQHILLIRNAETEIRRQPAIYLVNWFYNYMWTNIEWIE